MDELMQEVMRYLAAIDAFRAAGYEPSWRPELRAEANSMAQRVGAYEQPAPHAAH
jgi:hypothetical protein